MNGSVVDDVVQDLSDNTQHQRTFTLHVTINGDTTEIKHAIYLVNELK